MRSGMEKAMGDLIGIWHLGHCPCIRSSFVLPFIVNIVIVIRRVSLFIFFVCTDLHSGFADEELKHTARCIIRTERMKHAIVSKS